MANLSDRAQNRANQSRSNAMNRATQNVQSAQYKTREKKSFFRRILPYWFPILVIMMVLFVAWVVLIENDARNTPTDKFVEIQAHDSNDKTETKPNILVEHKVTVTVPAVTVKPATKPCNNKKPASANVTVVNEQVLPSFDMVRIGAGGSVIVSGRYLPNQKVSIKLNKQIWGTESTDKNGEFAFAPNKKLKPGNYTVKLIAVEQNLESDRDVFMYVSEDDKKYSSISLLMGRDGSKFLQTPMGNSGDLTITKVDYLINGRVLVAGSGLPRMRVNLELDGKNLGQTRISDSGNFGLGAPIDPMVADKKYSMRAWVSNEINHTIAEIKYEFQIPESKPDEDTYYTVRRGDTLWVISKNHYGSGIKYTVIFQGNNDKIKNANLIYPKQIFVVPMEARK